MRFIGSKKNILPELKEYIDSKANDGSAIFFDVFSGSGVVSKYFKNQYKIIANDLLYFSYVILRGAVLNNKLPCFSALKQNGIDDPLVYLNNLVPKINKTYFITRHYTPYKDSPRMYFSVENGAKIDAVRQQIEAWRKERIIDEDEYFYLLASLIEAVPFVSNTSGTYGAYLKSWDKRARKELMLEHFSLIDNYSENRAYNLDALDLSKEVAADIAYLDPPYNGRQYLSNYHVLETIAKYDYPAIKGVTGIRESAESESSKFCSKKKAYDALADVVRNLKTKHVFISYSSEGILSKEEIFEILRCYCIEESVNLKEVPYRKYKSKIISKEDNLFEYIFYGRKDMPLVGAKQNKKVSVTPKKKYVSGPINYIGGKYKLLPYILPHFPAHINTFVDLFAGGFNVGINVNAQKVICNDMNHYVIEIYEMVRNTPIDELLQGIEDLIQKYQLSPENEAGFLKLRQDYNKKQTPLVLYVLSCFSFNYQLRFNNNRAFNNPFGRNRSRFSESLKAKLIDFSERIKKIEVDFKTCGFEDVLDWELSAADFVYCDPPYLITTGSYNDGNRGFKDWDEGQEKKLYETLDCLEEQGIGFALSNVLTHKGVENKILREWSKKYHIIHIQKSYANSSYNTTRGVSEEVIVTNKKRKQ